MTFTFWLTTVALSFIVSFGYSNAFTKAEMAADSSQTGKTTAGNQSFSNLSNAEPSLTTEVPFTTVTQHGNITVNETEILENWFQFKHRFALQCALVFFMFGCVIFLCFIPDEPMFDISYNKYDTNEITKYATASNVKMASGKTAKTGAPAASKKRARAVSNEKSKSRTNLPTN